MYEPVILSYSEIMGMAAIVARKLVPYPPPDPLARADEVAAEAIVGVVESGKRGGPGMVRTILTKRGIDYLRRIGHFKKPSVAAKPKIERTGYIPTRISEEKGRLEGDDAFRVIESHLPSDLHVRIFRLMCSGENIKSIGRQEGLNQNGLWEHVNKIREVGRAMLADKPACMLAYPFRFAHF